jgi:hypothetical protein
MPGYNSQTRGTARTSHIKFKNFYCCIPHVPIFYCYVCSGLCILCVVCVHMCAVQYHRVSTQLQLNMSYNIHHIISYCLSGGSSSSFCGAGGIPPSALQPFEAYCAKPRSSPKTLHVRRRERTLLPKGGSMGEKWPVKFSLTMRLPRHYRVV